MEHVNTVGPTRVLRRGADVYLHGACYERAAGAHRRVIGDGLLVPRQGAS